ncbi:hypothetical protein V6N13_063739 [Hibiscus sabdariffa]|uniref:Uncharacterized protein n=1 Tax=Hibiscus sabdariffa TaxID=183260 RepID=A0ABR2R1T0_9ROSI
MLVIVRKIDGESVKIRESRDDGYADVNNTHSKRDINCWRSNHRKRPYLDLTETVPEMSTDAIERMPWCEVRSVSMDRGSDDKRLKMGVSGIHPYNNGRDEGCFSDGAASGRQGLCSGSSVEDKRCGIGYDEKVMPGEMGSSERFSSPAGSHRARQFLPIKDEGQVVDASPNLEFALGAEMRPPNKGILPLFVGIADKSDNLDKVTGKEEVEDVSASLSLSLSFPIAEMERNTKYVPESNRVNTSLLLFGGFHDKIV